MKIPPIPPLSLEAAVVDFQHARGLDMYQHVKRGPSAYEPDVLALLLCLLTSSDRARLINVGANMGYFALIPKRLLGDRLEVHAYEPMPELVERLRRGRDANGLDVTVSERALADFVGSAPFHLSARSDTSNSLNPRFRPARDVIDVPVSTIDAEFPARVGTDRRDPTATVLLVDTESTEPAVLRGATELIARERPAIVCEVLAGRTEAALSDVVAAIDYQPYALTDDGLRASDTIHGDRTYQHRDWLFMPREQPPPGERYRRTLEVVTSWS